MGGLPATWNATLPGGPAGLGLSRQKQPIQVERHRLERWDASIVALIIPRAALEPTAVVELQSFDGSGPRIDQPIVLHSVLCVEMPFTYAVVTGVAEANHLAAPIRNDAYRSLTTRAFKTPTTPASQIRPPYFVAKLHEHFRKDPTSSRPIVTVLVIKRATYEIAQRTSRLCVLSCSSRFEHELPVDELRTHIVRQGEQIGDG
jgi:hypothetical protein